MTLEQAIEILDPKNPYYEDSYTVHRARYMGMEALKIRMPKKVKNAPLCEMVLFPSCGYSYLYKKLEKLKPPFDNFCPECGQALDWSSLNWPDDKYEYEKLLNKIKKNKDCSQ